MHLRQKKKIFEAFIHQICNANRSNLDGKGVFVTNNFKAIWYLLARFAHIWILAVSSCWSRKVSKSTAVSSESLDRNEKSHRYDLLNSVTNKWEFMRSCSPSVWRETEAYNHIYSILTRYVA